MKPRRVVITGIGAITPIGHGACGLWRGIRVGKTAVHRVTRFDPSEFRSQNAAEIGDFDPLDHMEARAARRLDRYAQLGVAAARGAVADSELVLESMDRSRVGVALGSALGGLSYAEDQHTQFLEGGIRAVGTMLAIAVYGGASGANVAIDLDLRGPNLSNASSCASGAMAIGEAHGLIQRGEADVMLAGGVEAPLAPLVFGAFALIKAMSARNDDPLTASRPFDVDRDGFVMGEGAAILVLEERDAAVRRGASIYAEVLGYGQSNDGYHMTAPRPDGHEAARAIRTALHRACLRSEDIGYVNAHATGTPLGDEAEARALRLALGTWGEHVPVSGTKGLYGHALGASGAIEIAITALAMQREFLPGTSNLESRDAGCGVNVIAPAGMCRHVKYALSTSFGFGGANAALVLGQPDST
jgi:3-oxoacyl-[acyl-carrier-protein] synthase II